MPALPGLLHVDISNTLGPCLIGALISSMLYGLTSLQSYLYFVYYPDDTVWLKILVSIIWLLDTVHTALMSITVYYYLVTNYFNPVALVSPGHWSLFVSIVMNLAITCIVQAFFVVRIYHLCGPKSKWIVTGILSLSVLGHFAFGIETVVDLFVVKLLVKLPELSKIAVAPLGIFSGLSDFLIAGSLCVLLYEGRTGFKSTDVMISTLIRYAINRCLLTAGVGLIETIVFTAVPHSLWHLGIDFVVGKLYANSLLATLNCRIALRNTDAAYPNTIHVSGLDFTGSRAESRIHSSSNVLDLSVIDTSRPHTNISDESEGPTALNTLTRSKNTVGLEKGAYNV